MAVVETILDGDEAQIEDIDLYNADGSVNTDAIAELQSRLSYKLGLYGPKDKRPSLTNDFQLQYPYSESTSYKYQCLWFAGRRSLEYIKKYNLQDNRPYGRTALEGSTHANCTVSEFKANPVANAYIFWDMGNRYGHAAYVEAVDKDGSLWISECNGGHGWSGVINKSPGDTKFTPENNYSYGTGGTCLGFFVLPRVETTKSTSENKNFSMTMLVNSKNPLSEEIYGEGKTVPNLRTVATSGRDAENTNYQMNSEAYSNYLEMKHAYESENSGYKMNMCSAYRSYESQKSRYDANGGSSYYQGPLTSEHRTGLAVDLGTITTGTGGTGTWDNWIKNKSEHKKMFKWLYENSYKYGFILRYPKGTKSKTGIEPESWHYRYIGKKHAEKFKEKSKAYEKTDSSLGVTYSTYTYEEYHEETFGGGQYGKF